LSVAIALTRRSPSPGSVQAALYADELSTPMLVHEEHVEPAVAQARNSTEATPVPASLALAVTVNGSAAEPFT
jgi:hypothetical protein